MDDLITRVADNLIARVTGPMKFRLLLQPCMAIFFAVREGLKDAREGKPPYFWACLTDRGEREAMLKEGWKSIGKVFTSPLCSTLSISSSSTGGGSTLSKRTCRDHSGHRALPAGSRTDQSNRPARTGPVNARHRRLIAHGTTSVRQDRRYRVAAMTDNTLTTAPPALTSGKAMGTCNIVNRRQKGWWHRSFARDDFPSCVLHPPSEARPTCNIDFRDDNVQTGAIHPARGAPTTVTRWVSHAHAS